MIKRITHTDQISYGTQEPIELYGTIIKINAEGDPEKKWPIQLLIRIEESGTDLVAVTWNYELLDTFKNLSAGTSVAIFEGNTGPASNQREQIRVTRVTVTNTETSQKLIRKLPKAEEVRAEISAIITRYIKDKNLKAILEGLVLNEHKFFIWPAATSLHHAYPGGLAIHSLNVTKNAIALWETYRGENINIELIVAGSLLHDIGKLDEYKEDGSRTIFGHLISHPVSGMERVSDYCTRVLNIDSNRDTNILVLKNIILSHHEKLEFGAPVQPTTMEAMIVARSDAADATLEGISAELHNMQYGKLSDKLFVADGTKILKWK